MSLNNATLFFEVGVKLGLLGLYLSPWLSVLTIPVLDCEHHESRCIADTFLWFSSPHPGPSTALDSQQACTEHLIKERVNTFDYLLLESIASLVFYLWKWRSSEKENHQHHQSPHIIYSLASKVESWITVKSYEETITGSCVDLEKDQKCSGRSWVQPVQD